MAIKVVQSERIDWPPLYRLASEKYAPQVRLNGRGELENYVARPPFPLIDPNDQQAASKIIWNFSYGPQFGDEADILNVETFSYRNLGPPALLTTGHFQRDGSNQRLAWYNSLGRTEDYNCWPTGITPMLASVHAAGWPPEKRIYDNMRTVCPENWEMMGKGRETQCLTLSNPAINYLRSSIFIRIH